MRAAGLVWVNSAIPSSMESWASRNWITLLLMEFSGALGVASAVCPKTGMAAVMPP
ncbi:hypothetical protein D3C80_1780660 [compost metagenome]